LKAALLLKTKAALPPFQGAVARVLKSPADFIAAGLATPEQSAGLAAVGARYAMAMTPALAALVDRDDPADPIARQFVPDIRELNTHPALLKLASICAVYCRFCFRRESVGQGAANLSEPEFAAALDYIRAHDEIWEIVLTGGDPLSLSPRRLAQTTRALAAIPHVKILRWHTRLPVAAPERINAELAEALVVGHDKTVYVALHANHARELTPQARAACGRLIDRGIAMVSQSVLLKGVNDDVETLAALMRAFVETRIKPYYLHHGDLAPGTAHFRTTIAEGQALMRQLRGQLSGLAQPTYVLDIPGAHGKVPINAAYVEAADGDYALTDASGARHIYADRCAPSG
jgi:lysine 2,3-aminomutase